MPASKDELHAKLREVEDSLDADYVEERVTYVDDPADPQIRSKVVESHSAVRDNIRRHLATVHMHLDNVGIVPAGEGR